MKHCKKSAISFAALLVIVGANVGLAQSGGGRGMMERFQSLDVNNDGQLSATEAAEWREAVFLAMDANDDKMLTRQEYMSVRLGRGADPAQRGPRSAARQAQKDARFTAMDAAGNGYVTQAQFLSDGLRIFSAADADGNGSVSLPEFVAANWM